MRKLSFPHAHLGIGLIIIEVVYKKHQIKKQKRLEIARHAADKWRGTIEVRVLN